MLQSTVMIFSNSEFTALRTKFYNNTAVTSGGAISQRLSGFTVLEQCVFAQSSLHYAYRNFGSDIDAFQCTELRISETELLHNATDPTAAIEVNMLDIPCTLFTLKTNISYGSKHLSSTNRSFFNESIDRCKVFISPPVVVRPGGANHNSFIVGINLPGAYHNDCAL